MIPLSLRRWFILHFALDMLFAVPLLVFPMYFLSLFGWTTIDPLTARLVGAALFAIGVESLLLRNNKNATVFVAMLDLKILWSSAAIISILLSIYGGAPGSAWFFLAVFVVFCSVWSYYRYVLRKR